MKFEYIDWVLNNSKTINFGNLIEMSKKLKFRVIRAARVSLNREKAIDVEDIQGEFKSEVFMKKIAGFKSEHIIEK